MRSQALIALFTILLSALPLASCAPRQPQTIGDVKQETTVSYDSFKNIVTYVSPTFQTSQFSGFSSLLLRAFTDTTNQRPTLYQLYISDTNSNWFFYDEAYDNAGTKMKFIKIGSDVTGNAMTTEIFGIMLSEKYLIDHQHTGICVRAYGKKGKKVFTLPAHYIDGFLAKVKQENH